MTTEVNRFTIIRMKEGGALSYCPRCLALEKELAIVLQERDEARKAASTATDLMMKGEALREKMMFQAIVGEFPPKEGAVRG